MNQIAHTPTKYTDNKANKFAFIRSDKRAWAGSGDGGSN